MFNQNDYSFNDIQYLVKSMPLTAHNSIGFEAMCRYVNEHNGRCWTGQDADAMYALGYTGGAFREILCRFMVSDNYLRSLDDVKGISFARCVSSFFSMISNAKSHMDMRSPHNLSEFRDAFLHMYASVPLFPKNKILSGDFTELQKHAFDNKTGLFKLGKKEKFTVKEAKLALYLDKMGFYITGRDHRIITYAGHLQRKTVYPYSSAMMFFICSGIKRGISEITTNKKWISDLVKYYIGDKAFKKLYSTEFFRSYKVLAAYEADILNKTVFGKSLKQETGYTGNSFQEALALAWEKELLAEIGID